MVSFTKFVTAALLASSAVALPHEQPVKRSASSKRGAAYNLASTVNSLTGNTPVTWGYSWNMWSNGALPSNVEFVPMLWGSKMFGGWFSAIQTALASGSTYILGFNEPDVSSQAAMAPTDAANYYRQYITPFSGSAKLVTPAVTNGGGSAEGLNWMRTFMDSCSDCGMSALAVHWYGSSAEEFQTFVTQAMDFAKEYSLESVWVTEFALSSDIANGASSQASADFLNQVLPWLDSQDMVSRYAYYMCADPFLISGSGLTETGMAYTA
ncbi:alkali-sensitive linkage protein 1 [Aspergillus terreus]|uniref:Alkali-sensitive linkage protein 1 n=1 Tax=Aspergillus terreus TaxID=33178 RepID=A0A5M3Z5L8_ASPTE|nr:hypothetical protein ATETN484_0009020300 [Aspergillus terreus]GFF17654.1 alkali-sensitive linkage protein 1 [Aspergillus terreus]